MASSSLPSEAATAAFSLRGLGKSYDDFTLGPLELELEPGTVLALVGPNGAGKTITFKALLVVNALIVFAGQGFFLIEEARVRSAKWAYLLLVLWLGIVLMVSIFPPLEGESLAAAFQRLLDTPLRQLALYLAVPTTVALNLRLFVRRRQWLS